MSLHTLDLPAPLQLRGRWAALAAVFAARGWPENCHAKSGVWHYDDGGGNWVRLHNLDQDRAVMVGNDHEYSDTYYGPAAEYFSEPETDILAGAPDWWSPPVQQGMTDFDWVGFAYGYEAGVWRRAAYDLKDGFESIGLPALNDTDATATILRLAEKAPGLTQPPDPAAVAALLAAGPELTAAQLIDVIGTGGWSSADGVAAARAFASR